jgi:hypothetical protein
MSKSIKAISRDHSHHRKNNYRYTDILIGVAYLVTLASCLLLVIFGS